MTTKIVRTFQCKSGNWETFQHERRSAGLQKLAEAMNRSIGRLAGIACVFSRGFRSTAPVTMPIKVIFSGFSFFICNVRTSDVFLSSLHYTCT